MAATDAICWSGVNEAETQIVDPHGALDTAMTLRQGGLACLAWSDTERRLRTCDGAVRLIRRRKDLEDRHRDGPRPNVPFADRTRLDLDTEGQGDAVRLFDSLVSTFWCNSDCRGSEGSDLSPAIHSSPCPFVESAGRLESTNWYSAGCSRRRKTAIAQKRCTECVSRGPGPSHP